MQDLVQHPIFIPALICALFLIANIYVFLTREWEGNHRSKSYAQINYPLDTPSLLNWRISGQRIYPNIIWNKSPSHWQVIKEGKVVETVPGASPFITLADDYFKGDDDRKLDEFEQHFLLRPLPAGIGRDVSFVFRPISREFYLNREMDFPKDLIGVKSNVPVGHFKRHAVSDWVDDYSYIDQASLVEADRIIRDDMHITDQDTQLSRIEKIVHFMRDQFIDAGGVPKNDFRWKNPFQIFSEMRSGQGKGWCTQNAQIYTFFANRAGIATRFVYCGTVQSNQFIHDGHSWAESYLEEQNRWLYVDPQQVVIGVFHRDGRALNTADVFQLCQLDSFEGFSARTFRNWQWSELPVEGSPDQAISVPFSLVNRCAKKQFTPHTIIKYRRPPNMEDIRHIYSILFTSGGYAWSNFKRYLWHYDLAYSNMPTKGNCVYRLRQSLFAGLILSAAWLACAVT